MIIGADAISQTEYGMLKEHFEALIKTAEKENAAIGIRPVSKFARSLIEEGHPTKPFPLKAKSAKAGIASGFIPLDPQYSHILPNEYEKHHKQIDYALHHDPLIKSTPLVITENRIHELSHFFDASTMTIKKENESKYSITWKNGSGNTMRVFAEKNAEGDFALIDENKKPIEAIGRTVIDEKGKEIVKPITADYDLLVIAPSYQTFDPGNEDKTPFRTQGNLHKTWDDIKKSTEPGYEGPKENPTAGNWTKRTEKIVNEFNNQIRVVDQQNPHRNHFKGLDTMWHNNEFHNPFADDMKYNIPCLFVFPQPIDMSSIPSSNPSKNTNIVLIQSVEELKQLRTILHEQGYYWPTHGKYKEINPFREETIATVEKIVASKLLLKSTSTSSLLQKFYENPPDSKKQVEANPTTHTPPTKTTKEEDKENIKPPSPETDKKDKDIEEDSVHNRKFGR